MQLTRRSLILLLVTAPILALGVWRPEAFLAAALWLLIVAALLAADWRMSPTRRDWEVTRRHDERLSLAAENPITITVHLRTLQRGTRPVSIWLRDDPPAVFGIADDQRVLAAEVIPGVPVEISYSVRPPRRGDYRFGDIYLRWASTLGLLRLQARFAAAEAVKVYPNLMDVRKYDLMLRKNRLWELGLRATRQRGSGSEYERLRDYQTDDEYRRINWKATARRGKPISVEFETERSQNIVALLDIGRMMRSPVGDVAKMDYAINAVLLLTYVAAQKGDRVGLLTFADRAYNWIAPRSGRAQFHRMLEQLYGIESRPIEPDYALAFSYFGTKQTRRSLVVVFSDLTGSISTATLVAQMARLRRRHLPLLVTLRDPTVQRLALQRVEDSAALYQRTVAEQLLDERRLTLDQLQRQGVHTLDVTADQLSIAVVNRYLELKARTLI